MTSKVCYETYTEGLESQGFEFQISKMYRTFSVHTFMRLYTLQSILMILDL